MSDHFIFDMSSDTFFMQQALREARKAYAANEVPIGAVIVKDEQIIARGWNQVETLKDATAHAEMLALTAAQQVIGDWRLEGCTLYVTKEPCPMCAGAILQARISRLVYGAMDPKAGAVGSLYQLLADDRLNHQVEVTPGVLAGPCGEILTNFFAHQRSLGKK